MPLIIEDGTGVIGAQSYATVAEAQSYAEARGINSLSNDDSAEQWLIRASDYMETFTDFQGVTTYTDQVLKFPRNGLYINDVYVDKVTIAPLVKKCQIEIALMFAAGVDLLSASLNVGESQVKNEKVGPIEQEYFESSSFNVATTPAVDAYLNQLRNVYLGFRTVRV